MDEQTCSSPPLRSSSSFGWPGSGPGLPLCRHHRASSDALQENGPSSRRLWSLKPVLTDRSCSSSCSDTAWSGSRNTNIPLNSFNTCCANSSFALMLQKWTITLDTYSRICLLELSWGQSFINLKSQISKQENSMWLKRGNETSKSAGFSHNIKRPPSCWQESAALVSRSYGSYGRNPFENPQPQMTNNALRCGFLNMTFNERNYRTSILGCSYGKVTETCDTLP